MNEFDITFSGGISQFDPGAEIAVDVSWNFKQEPDVIEARLVWNTSGKGDRDLKIVKAVRIEQPAAVDRQQVVFQLPWGPYSFSGKLISLIWAIEIVAVPGTASLRQEITVAPRGQEVLITK